MDFFRTLAYSAKDARIPPIDFQARAMLANMLLFLQL